MKRPDWFDKLLPFTNSTIPQSLLFLLTSTVSYLAIVVLMFVVRLKGLPYWIVLVLAALSSGFYIRSFIVLHDCSHMSFFKSKKACSILGHFCGILSFTPFFDWQRNHGIHHANVSNLDKRGIGDVWTMTLNEYREANPSTKLLYRIFRNPFFLFVIAPPILFVVMYRFPQKSTRRKDYFSIIFTDVILVLIVIIAHYTVGIKNYVAVQLPIVLIAMPVGLWLFYIQHQFENVYWVHAKDWDLISAAMKGGSFYKLPELLRWATGNIGYHNLHHINPRIPCYFLKECYEKTPDLHYTTPITLISGFKSLRLRLWDEDANKLISFKDAARKMNTA
ncbi:MAG TPA: fatty acid desaturase [Spirochaetota bacterium]